MSRAATHEALVGPWADAFSHRRKEAKAHAVHDFLFIYYNFPPPKLKQWIPSIEERLVFNSDLRQQFPWLKEGRFLLEENELFLNRERLTDNMRGLATFVATLCETIGKRPPRFGCFGLHEWAMVYKASPEAIRHQGSPLRLSSEKLASFVESQTICCSHYDAYRFFTEEARPLNVLNPTLESRLQMEQAGCLHANMDLYKWAIKLWPWIGSDFLAKAFLLALEGRELDMRASPYDLNGLGYAPILIETEEGRRQYQQEQQRFTDKAAPLRAELGAFCKRLSHLCIEKDG